MIEIQKGSVTYTYDAFNNKTRVKNTQGKTVTYRYNQKVQETYAGMKVNYTYNEDDLLESVLKTMDDSIVRGKSFPISQLSITANRKEADKYPVIKDYENKSTESFAINSVKNYHSHRNDAVFNKPFQPYDEDKCVGVYNIKI